MISNNEKSRLRKEYVIFMGFRSEDGQLWINKYHSLAGNARTKGLLCELNFNQYLDLAREAGLTSPDQIGKRPDQYQMGRIGDTGNYVIGNCRFITQMQNTKEKMINGGSYRGAKFRGLTAATSPGLASMVRKNTGKTKFNHPGTASQADKLSKEYRIVSPNGTVYEGKGISSFCKKHGLCKIGIGMTCMGKQKQHKGWTGEYISYSLKDDMTIEV